MAAAVAPTAEGARRRAPLVQTLLGRNPVGWALVAPYAFFIGLVFAYPLGFAVWISFHDYFFAAPGASVSRPWTGFSNYTHAIGDSAFRQSCLHVAEFVVINVPLTSILALLLATALNARLPFRGLFRTAYYIPYVTASVAVVGVWLWLFSEAGLANHVLGGLAPTPSWLVNSSWTMPLIAFFVTWKQLGFYVLIYLAALQNVPRELYEAAEVDGAGRIQQFRSVTVPGVRSASVLVLVTATVTGASLFTEPYLLTGEGGPDGASTTPVLLMYRQAIEQNHPGYAAAIGIMLAIVALAIAGVYRRLLED